MYKRHRFPPEIIQHAVWLYHRFNLSARDIEDLLAERGIAVSYKSIRLWCIKLGSKYANRLRRRHQGYGDTFFIDEVFVKIQGKQQYLWRAVDQDGEVVDVFLQRRRDGAAAKRFFKRLLRVSGGEPRRIVTDKLRGYGVAHREVIPDTIHDTSQYVLGANCYSSRYWELIQTSAVLSPMVIVQASDLAIRISNFFVRGSVVERSVNTVPVVITFKQHQFSLQITSAPDGS